MRLNQLISSLFLLLICTNSLYSRIINVPEDFPTIQAGIEEAIDGDTVLVAPESYPENINFLGKSIFLTSLFYQDHDSTMIESTIIDGMGDVVVNFSNGEDRESVISGFTLTNGSYCIYCSNSSPTIQYNNIVDNSVNHWGAGVSCWDEASPLIAYNLFENNFASYGGGAVFAHSSTPTIEYNVIRSNYAIYGGAICSAWYSEPLIRRNLIYNNVADQTGGGIHLSSMTPQVINNTIVMNSAPLGAGVYSTDHATSIIKNNIIAYNEQGAGIKSFHYSEPEISYNDVWNNAGGNYEGVLPGEGDISENPEFIDLETFNFNLYSFSPCIDAGDPESPPDPDGTRADIGALYFPGQGPEILLSVDPDSTYVHRSGMLGFVVTAINTSDSTIFFQGWTECETPWGLLITPALGPINAVLGAHQTIAPHFQQIIPESAVFGGPYFYTVKVGEYPDQVIAEASFDFFIIPGKLTR